jgi:hypothetical protein
MANKKRKKRNKKPGYFDKRDKIKQILLEGIEDAPPLKVIRTTEVQFQSRNKKEFIYFEKNGDNNEWTITYTANTIPNADSLEALILLRESDLREENRP